MLAPDSRMLLLDALRPPSDYAFDRAVATTFTLDLTTALTIPLALAGFSLTGVPDPIAVMEAVQSTAEHMDIFCQAGMISAAALPSDLVALLEGVVHTVDRPRPGHLFHPKLWVVRYRRETGELTYRCLVLSRNLTADSSWDVLLRLDANADESRINRGNYGLIRFVSALASIPGTDLSGTRRASIETLAEELRRVTWHLPDDVEAINFYPFGIRGVRKPNTAELFRGTRHLLISPFITAGGIELLLGDSGSTELSIVARPEELDLLEIGTLDDANAFAINPLAGLAEPDIDGASEATSVANVFGALHAKVYVVEANRRARVLLGSANATDAAFGGNVELLCELSGRSSKLGVATMLGDDAPFLSLLEEYEHPPEPITDARGEAGRKLEAFLVDVAEVGFTATCRNTPDGWTVTIESRHPLPKAPEADDLKIGMAPYNRAAERWPLVPGALVHAELPARVAAEITPFLVLDATATIEGERVERRAIAVAELVGSPHTRLEDIIIRQIDTPERFQRFLTLLFNLAAGQNGITPMPGGDANGLWRTVSTTGIFELLVRALAVSPDAIDRLEGIVDRLRSSELGDKVLPADWDKVWQAVVDARQLLRRTPG